MTYFTTIDTPAGQMLLVGDGETVSGMYWSVFKRTPAIGADWIADPAVFAPVIAQLDEYFGGTRQAFDFAFTIKGTPFQQKVWDELRKIPYGEQTSYQAIAHTIGAPKAVRAVGTAVGSNPIAVVVPCHRVLTSDNRLGGYAGGLPGKQLLLKNEGITWRV